MSVGQIPRCGVCGITSEYAVLEYCGGCKVWICQRCKWNIPARGYAALKTWVGW